MLKTELVQNAIVERHDGRLRLVPRPRQDVPLQPLRIPWGWLVDFNDGLYEIDPSIELVEEPDRLFLFKQDMLQMKHERFNRLLDVGWYPEGDLVEGRYGLVIHEGDFLGPLLHEFQTSDRKALVTEIERLLLAVCNRQL